MLTKEQVRQELIGLDIEVIEAKNPTLIGIKGKIIDETKYTLTIKDQTIKKILKDQVTLKMNMKQKIIQVKGTSLLQRSEDRLKQ